jgi:hypothetical protein
MAGITLNILLKPCQFTVFSEKNCCSANQLEEQRGTQHSTKKLMPISFFYEIIEIQGVSWLKLL